ncbi:MAG: hypothetical protein ABL995_20395 [Bryobacteraceae bacterium]
MTPHPHDSQAEEPGKVLSSNRTSAWERIALAVLLLVFAAFTWRGLLSFYSGDDMMNSYWAWTWNHKSLVWANLLVWLPIYRPLGETIYLIFYAVFGFAPLPLYIFSWLLLLANVVAAYAMFRALFRQTVAALLALALMLVHGAYNDLYYSAGTIFDRLWFTFTVLGVAAYVRTRENSGRISFIRLAWLSLLSVFAMDSKESGVTIIALFAGYECLFVLPRYLREKTLRAWVKDIAPLYGLLTVTSAAFLFGRVMRTEALVQTSSYHPKASLSVWLSSVATYCDMLAYRKDLHGVAGTTAVLLALAVAALLLRNKLMAFGLLWFVVTITPVALITPRPGYVLYVPGVGLGLYFGELLALTLRKLSPRGSLKASIAMLAAVVIATSAWHAANWPVIYPGNKTAHFQLADQLHRDYPTMPRGAKLLFASDFFAPGVWDMTMMLRLLYHDKTLEVFRLHGAPDMQPPKGVPIRWDHVFVAAGSHYEELESHDLAESLRLHILRNYTVGRSVAFYRPDHSAYVVSGVKDFDGPDEGRWTEPKATLKFDLYPADTTLAVRYWVAPFVAEGPEKTLTVRVNGNAVGATSLSESGEKEIRLPVKAAQISALGFTLVDLEVDHPYKDPGGEEFGIILFQVGFEYKSR